MTDDPVRAFPITHVGLTVTDIERAVRWYVDVLGFTLIAGPADIRAGAGEVGRAVADAFGAGYGASRHAHLAAGNGVALEMLEFVDPPTEPRPEPFDYWRTGFSHICVVDPDVEGLAARIVDAGGRMRTSRIWSVFPGQKYRFCYCEDPFGNVLEIFSHSHEQTFSNQGS